MKLFASVCVSSALLWLCACSSSDSTDTTNTQTTTGLKAYVGLFGDNAVAVVDTASNKVVKTIPVPTGPHGLVITPDGSKVYVSSDGATVVSVIATSSDTIVKSIEVGVTPHGLAMAPDGSKVLLSDFGGDQAEIIDTATDEVVTMVAMPKPHNSAISTDSTRGFVGSQQADTPSIAVIDLAAGTIMNSVPVEKAPRALDYAGGQVYFTMMGIDALAVLDSTTNELGAQIPTGGSPHHMIATKDGAFELVVSQTAGDLEFVDPTLATVVANVPTGMTPHWIALSGDGKNAYVTNEGSDSLSIVDVAGRTVSQTIMVGKKPRKVAVQAR